jgi:hypothetical protein
MIEEKPPPQLVIDLCRALVAAGADRRTAYWINVDRIREALGVPLGELDVAVAYAVAHKLVRVDGLPDPHSLTLTYEGFTLSSASQKAGAKTSQQRPSSSRDK